ncbi:MAG: sugar ABC transporter permease [Spirochaetes bacterium]|nr:sugar ABC transporter permease [Spirochaetota bacterium]
MSSKNQFMIRSPASPYIFLAPAFIIILFILCIPIISVIRTSFFEYALRDIGKAPQFIGIQNYIELFTNEYYRTSVAVTLKFSISVVIIEICIGLILALLLESGIKGLRFFRTIFTLPIMIAPVVVGVMWRFLYNPTYGKINYFLGVLGIEPVGWLSDPNIALISVIIADVWQWTPFVFLLCLAGLQGVPGELLEAARVDGTNYFEELIHIKIPYILPVINVAIVFRLIDSFKVLVVIYNLTFGGPGVTTEVLSLHLYKTAFVGQRLGMGSAEAVALLVILSLLSIVLIITNMNKER